MKNIISSTTSVRHSTFDFGHSTNLIPKYNVPGPRYTSYPTVPHWKEDGFSLDAWKQQALFQFDHSNDEGISLYIHLPYCYSLCTFCGCHKHITKNESVKDPYINTVLKEWQLYLDLFQEAPIIKELHLGGGTPTFFEPEQLVRLVEGIFEKAERHADLEMSFEGHPNNTSKEHLQQLYDIGFRRVSFGVQDYAPKVQKAINRIQPFERVETVHETARLIGYTSISHDLVYGLPHQTLEDILETIRLTRSLLPDRISLYSYAHVPWVKGVGQRGFDEADLPKDAEKRALYEAAKKALTTSIMEGLIERSRDEFSLTISATLDGRESSRGSGLANITSTALDGHQKTVSSFTERSRGESSLTTSTTLGGREYQEIGMDHFALETDGLYQSFKQGKLHRNFMGYTTNNTQLMVGLGMSAISDSWTAFAQNVKTVKEYTALVEAGEIPVFRGHVLSQTDLRIRKHILNLMCQFHTEWDEDFAQEPWFDTIIQQLRILERDGLLSIGANFVVVSELGKIFIRNICMCFDLHLQVSKRKERVFSRVI